MLNPVAQHVFNTLI